MINPGNRAPFHQHAEYGKPLVFSSKFKVSKRRELFFWMPNLSLGTVNKLHWLCTECGKRPRDAMGPVQLDSVNTVWSTYGDNSESILSTWHCWAAQWATLSKRFFSVKDYFFFWSEQLPLKSLQRKLKKRQKASLACACWSLKDALEMELVRQFQWSSSERMAIQ